MGKDADSGRLCRVAIAPQLASSEFVVVLAVGLPGRRRAKHEE